MKEAVESANHQRSGTNHQFSLNPQNRWPGIIQRCVCPSKARQPSSINGSLCDYLQNLAGMLVNPVIIWLGIGTYPFVNTWSRICRNLTRPGFSSDLPTGLISRLLLERRERIEEKEGRKCFRLRVSVALQVVNITRNMEPFPFLILLVNHT